MTIPNSGETQVSTNLQLPSYQPDKIVHFILGQHAALIDAMPTGRDGDGRCSPGVYFNGLLR